MRNFLLQELLFCELLRALRLCTLSTVNNQSLTRGLQEPISVVGADAVLVISKAEMAASHKDCHKDFPRSFFSISSLVYLSEFYSLPLFICSQVCYCCAISEARNWLVS